MANSQSIMLSVSRVSDCAIFKVIGKSEGQAEGVFEKGKRTFPGLGTMLGKA
jgi:hypothetical protein